MPALANEMCSSAPPIILRQEVVVDPQFLARLKESRPLRVTALDAPPMAYFDEKTKTHAGIGIDILCYLKKELGLDFKILSDKDLDLETRIRRLQEGHADIMIALSYLPDRDGKGIFSIPFYDSYYAVIARLGSEFSVIRATDLAGLKVGTLHSASFESVLRELVPPENLHVFDHSFAPGGMFQALRNNQIDVAVYSKNIFVEKRFRHELFDLEVIDTLREYPRYYRFYMQKNEFNQQLSHLLDRYISVMDLSKSNEMHEIGERKFLERYVRQRSWQAFWQAAMAAALVLMIFAFFMLRRYRRLSMQLAESNVRILQQQKALRAANELLEKRSHTDGLTELANRRHFDQALEREHSRWRRMASPLSLLIVDIDHFKRVNDHYGHLVGDDYLRSLSRVLEASVSRSTDVVARYGGEEFACLLPDTGVEDAIRVALLIQQNLVERALPNIMADPQQLTVSIGIACLVDGDYQPNDLLAQADMQLYAAKNAGRNCVRAVVLQVSGITSVDTA